MFSLLMQKRFLPFFLTMGLGALNDNLFKSSLVILIAYHLPKDQADIYVQMAAGLFILPFFIFSGISGQLCDKYEKTTLIRFVKAFEILIMVAGSIGFFTHQIPFLLFTLFLMGVHSTIFGPVKYSILPQHLSENELLAGNSLVSMGTFLAILIGTIAGGMLVTENVLKNFSYWPISMAILLTASFGLIFGLIVPKAQPADPTLKLKLNPFTETWQGLKYAFANPWTKLSILAISWFWFFGFFYMASLPSYCRDILKGDEATATLLLTMISLGMGLGSILINKVSGGSVKLGPVIFGGAGLTIFSLDLTFLSTRVPSHELHTISEFLSLSFPMYANYRALLDFFFIGIFGGIFIVPLYTLMQHKAPSHMGSRIVASNNIWNSVFMVSAAVTAIICFKIGLDIKQIFLLVSVLNIGVTLILLWKLPEHFYLTFFAIAIRCLYRLRVIGADNIPRTGGALIVANHVSFIDPLIIAAASHRPPRYMMDKAYYDIPWLKWFFVTSKSIPVTPKKIDPALMENAILEVVEGLKRGELITIFPEGFITSDGNMIPFKEGIERISKLVDVVIIPTAIRGMWGSWFSRINGSAMKGVPPNRGFAKVEIIFGEPTHSSQACKNKLHDTVKELRGSML